MKSAILFVLVLAVNPVYGAESILGNIDIYTNPARIYPGEEVNITFAVKNPTAYEHVLRIELKEIPESFEVPYIEVLKLKPGETEIVVLPVKSPAGIPLRAYFFSYDIKDEIYDSLQNLLETHKSLGNWDYILVAPAVDISYRTAPEKVYAPQQEPLKVTFTLANLQRREHRIGIESLQDRSRKDATLKPGEAGEVIFELEVPKTSGEHAFLFNIFEEYYNGKEFVPAYQREVNVKVTVLPSIPISERIWRAAKENASIVFIGFVFIFLLFKSKIIARLESLDEKTGARVAIFLGVAYGYLVYFNLELLRENIGLVLLLHLVVIFIYLVYQRKELAIKILDRMCFLAGRHPILINMFIGISIGFLFLPVLRVFKENGEFGILVLTLGILLLMGWKSGAGVTSGNRMENVLRYVYEQTENPRFMSIAFFGFIGGMLALRKYQDVGDLSTLLAANTSVLIAAFLFILMERNKRKF